jgi:hypothetical protein
MGGFGWVVLAVLVLLFGKNLSTTTAALFSQPNSVPTPDTLPALSIQNQGNQNNANAPPPWATTCSYPSLVVPPPQLPGGSGFVLGGNPKIMSHISYSSVTLQQ